MAKKKDSGMPEGWISLLDQDVEKIDEKIAELQKEKNEKETIAKYRQQIKENDILKRNGIDTFNSKKQKVVRKSFYRLLKYSIIFLLIILVSGIIVFAYLIDNDKLKDTVLCGDVKCQECQPCQTCSNVTCEKQVCNPYVSCNVTLPNEIIIKNSS